MNRRNAQGFSRFRESKDMIRLESYDSLNSEITGDYDEARAVKCINGTFVGTGEHGVATWLGIYGYEVKGLNEQVKRKWK